MPTVLKRNAVIVFALAALFCWSFMLAKHSPALRDIIPFGDDPYDAVGSYGVIVGILTALLSLFRAFRHYHKAPTKVQQVYLIRSQEAVVLAILITLAADVVAMARHPTTWIGAASRDSLIAVLSGMAILTVSLQVLIRNLQGKFLENGAKGWKRAATVTLLSILTLVLYPEQLINGIATHLLTVLAGAIVLLVPMRALLNALVPYDADEGRIEKAPVHGDRFSYAWQRWAAVLLLGALIGAFAFVGEFTEGSGALALGRLVFVASVFVGLGLAGLVIAYAFLGEPLGLKARG